MATEEARKVVKVVVLGDIGRSPRMQYHALSLADNGIKVKIIGYLDSAPLPEISEHAHITINQLYTLPLDKAPRLVRYAAKLIWQTISLLLTLFISGKCDYLLCQNPPAIPTLPVCRFYCLISRAKFIIDWHNYAYSIMAMSLSPDHIIVRVARAIERFFGQSADHNLCVTYSMKEDLLTHWGLKSATVLYDRPPKIFHPITLDEKHDWFVKLSGQYPEFGPGTTADHPEHAEGQKTAFTQVVADTVQTRYDRPGLVFSSTSWTADEDFGIMIDAFQVYETTYETAKNLPKLMCVITGKGPMKEHYLKLIAEKNWQHITVITPWLEAADYPKMVASADLGVCLHTSSSGLDLPMKVVDMFGAGLPVCAFDFLCLDELVEEGINGYTFKNSDELAKQIVNWFREFPTNERQNHIAERMRSELAKFQKTRWEENWNLRVKKYFTS
ncbi:ALG1, chitobiosyldiphosphodolichol beta-mannosyltransferase [Anticarsia gemmatalis]|uniref:ALG1, chitobiosyldiphosphodolichol beta-mannosyltransferase n=1 Tax=Anticarsia gemmatalis TaxID=129554 RepID=UPI003F771600